MSEEEVRKIVDTIKQEEFPYALAIAKAYEKLEKENKSLKDLSCRQANEIEIKNNILTEFEEFLEDELKKEIKHPTPEIYHDCVKCKTIILNKLKKIMDGKK